MCEDLQLVMLQKHFKDLFFSATTKSNFCSIKHDDHCVVYVRKIKFRIMLILTAAFFLVAIFSPINPILR
jgi:hypothetical protein